MRIRCVHIASAAFVFAAAPSWSLEGRGLDPSDNGWLAGRWQARVELSPGWANSIHADPYNIATHGYGLKQPGFSVLGDFFFRSKSLSSADTPASAFSGFRATSGLMVGSRLAGAVVPGPLPEGHGDNGPVPYFGVGYTDLPGSAGWGFRADFGLMALTPRAAVKFGGVLSGAQGVDDLLRDLRLSPLIQLGVSYSF